MRILFWGTPEFALPSLRALLGSGHEVVGVVTQPDRPAGRGRKTTSSEVKAFALERGLPVLTPEKPVGHAFLSSLRALRPDVSVVAAYGHILRPELLALPRLGSVNVHASLLPELRGAAPVNWAIVRGHDRTGVTIMRMTMGMDEGPILLQREVSIGAEETASELYGRLAELGAAALLDALTDLEHGRGREREQDHSKATYAPKVGRDTARVDWTRPAREVSDHLRGMDAVPGGWTLLGGDPLKLFRPTVVAGASGEPGRVLEGTPVRGLIVATGSGAVRLAEVQPAGKRRMTAEEWLRGQGGLVGEKLT